MTSFKAQILLGIPNLLPAKKQRGQVSHAPRRKDILNTQEKQLGDRWAG